MVITKNPGHGGSGGGGGTNNGSGGAGNICGFASQGNVAVRFASESHKGGGGGGGHQRLGRL